MAEPQPATGDPQDYLRSTGMMAPDPAISAERDKLTAEDASIRDAEVTRIKELGGK